MEGPEEEEEKVNVHVITHLPITCSLLKRAGGEFSLKTSGTELFFLFFFYNSKSNKLMVSVGNHTSVHHD